MTRAPSAVAASILALGLATDPAFAVCADAPLEIRSDVMSGPDIRSFEARFRAALVRACDWWGPTFNGPYRVDIEDNRGPSMALVPAWRGERGQMLFRARPVRENRTAITHEIVHVLAPNANRFLAEGLASWAHQHLDGETAYPNFGRALHTLAKPLAGRADLAALERLATPKRLRIDGLDDRDAYIVAGSFVGFLIESHGLDRFRDLYGRTPLLPKQQDAGIAARWSSVYGRDLAGLSNDWRAFLAAR